MTKYFLILFLFLSVLIGGCSLFANEEKVKVEIDENPTEKPAILKDKFLWEIMGDEKYAELAAKMRCAANDEAGYSDKQLVILIEYGLDRDEYDLENNRPDWLVKYAEAGLEEKVQEKVKELCGE